MPAGTIQTGKLNVVLSGISPVDAAVNVVQGEAIRPSDLGVHYDAPVCAIHAYLANQGVVTPVCPVQEAMGQETGRVKHMEGTVYLQSLYNKIIQI